MEEELQTKMREFMIVLDQVKKYKELLRAFPDFLIIIALSIIGILSAQIVGRLELVFVTYINPFWTGFVSSLIILILLIGVIIGLYWVNRRVKKVKVEQWKKTLKEGAPGAIKLLQVLNWSNIFSDIRYAKLGFWFYSIAKITVFWVITVLGLSILAGWVVFAFHLNVDFLVVGSFSLVLVLILSIKDLHRRFNQIGDLDALMWELRWFDNEFRRSDFKT